MRLVMLVFVLQRAKLRLEFWPLVESLSVDKEPMGVYQCDTYFYGESVW